MDPFSITCETCAAKLKVTNPSAIGQKLACPKCGSMVFVQAPENWSPPESESSINGNERTGDSSEIDFDDIDQILQQKPNPQSAPKTTPRSQTAGKSKQAAPKSPQPMQSAKAAKPAPEDASPMLPDDRWTNQATQKRQSLLLIVSAIVGLTLVIGAIVIAVNANRSNNGDVAQAENPEKIKSESATDPIKDTSDSDNSIVSAETNSEIETNLSPENDDAESTSQGSEELDSVPDAESHSIPDQPPIDDTSHSDSSAESQSENKSDEASNQAMATEDSPVENETAQAIRPSPFQSDLDDILRPLSSGVDDVTTNFDALSDALENKGSSLFELNQWAILSSEQRRIGLPKYYVKRPPELDPRNMQELDKPVLGVQLPNHSFLQFLAEFTQITGAPISFDTNSDFFDDFDFGFELVNFQHTNSNYRDVIETVLKSVTDRLSLSTSPLPGVTIGLDRPSEIESVTIPAAMGNSRSADDLVKLIQQLIAPGTWNDNENRTIEYMNDSFRVQHRPPVVAQIRQLCSKWNTAMDLQGNSQVQSRFSPSRWEKSSVARQKTLQLRLADDTPLLDFAALIKKETGVNLLFDFNSLMEHGWNPKTLVPMNFSEPTIEELLGELSHSMDVSFRAINSNSFEIISHERLAELTEVEFYDCGDILSGNLNRQQLIEIVRQALQSTNRLDGSCRVYFENELNCFVVIGAQDAQRLVESILQRLKKL